MLRSRGMAVRQRRGERLGRGEMAGTRDAAIGADEANPELVIAAGNFSGAGSPRSKDRRGRISASLTVRRASLRSHCARSTSALVSCLHRLWVRECLR